MKENCLIIDRWRWHEACPNSYPRIIQLLDFVGIREDDGAISWFKNKEKGPHHEHYDD